MKAWIDPFDVFGRPVETLIRYDGSQDRTVKIVRSSPASIYLARRFLGGQESCVKSGGHVSLASLLLRPNGVARGSDLLIARVSRRVSRMMAAHDVIRVPECVRLIRPLPLSSEERRRIKSSQSENLRRIRKHKLTYSLSHAKEDFDHLWHTMVLPYAESRFGDLAERHSYKHALKAFDRGVLLFVLQDGRKIAGTLLDLSDNRVSAVSLGMDGGFENAMRIGALSAIYYFTIEWAEREGFDCIDMGNVRPCLADGVFRTKYRWGGQAVDEETCQDLVLCCDARNPLVCRFFEENPLVIRDGDGLSAIGALPREAGNDPGALGTFVDSNLVPGLSRIFVLPGFDRQAERPQQGCFKSSCRTASPQRPPSSASAAKPLTL